MNPLKGLAKGCDGALHSLIPGTRPAGQCQNSSNEIEHDCHSADPSQQLKHLKCGWVKFIPFLPVTLSDQSEIAWRTSRYIGEIIGPHFLFPPLGGKMEMSVWLYLFRSVQHLLLEHVEKRAGPNKSGVTGPDSKQ